MTREEIFNKTVRERFEERKGSRGEYVAMREAVIYAVQNTDRIWYGQPQKDKESSCLSTQ